MLTRATEQVEVSAEDARYLRKVASDLHLPSATEAVALLVVLFKEIEKHSPKRSLVAARAAWEMRMEEGRDRR